MKHHTVLRVLLALLVTFQGLLEGTESRRVLKGHSKNGDWKKSDRNKGERKSKKQADCCTLKADIGTYPGYTGPLDPSGQFEVTFYNDRYLAASFYGTGLEPNCLLCGVHIHTGTTCDDADLVGDHFYKQVAVGIDPWTVTYGATYNSNTRGESFAGYTIDSGYGCKANRGHAVVVHAQDGSRYGCGILY